MKKIVYILLAFVITIPTSNFAQEKNSFSWNDNVANENIYMTWNKNTPEAEMKDDIKALAEKGVTIKYSNVKRNSKNEITAIKVDYSDRKGNKGTLQLENQKPINTIKFYKQNDEVGFGEPSNNSINMMNGGDFFQNFSNGNDIMKQFQFNFDTDSLSTNKFEFKMPDSQNFGQTKSRIIIKNDGKKQLVIENGEVIEGGDDYTKEELDEIKKNHSFESFDGNGKHFEFNFNDGEMEKMQDQIQKMAPRMEKYKLQFDGEKENTKSNSEDLEKTKEEMIKAKEEMIKAKEELEKAKKDLEKAKSTLKIQKT